MLAHLREEAQGPAPLQGSSCCRTVWGGGHEYSHQKWLGKVRQRMFSEFGPLDANGRASQASERGVSFFLRQAVSKMPYLYSIPYCNGNYNKGPKVSVFSFPRDEVLSRKRLRAIKKGNFATSASSKVSLIFVL